MGINFVERVADFLNGPPEDKLPFLHTSTEGDLLLGTLMVNSRTFKQTRFVVLNTTELGPGHEQAAILDMANNLGISENEVRKILDDNPQMTHFYPRLQSK